MKKIFLSLLIVMYAIGGTAQTIIFPSYTSRDNSNVEISRISLTDTLTIVEMYFLAPIGDSWICADKNFHIKPYNSNDRFFLVLAENISLCPKRDKISRDKIYKKFLLYFPILDSSVKRIDIIEKAKDGFNFYGVWLEEKQEEPLPDSSKYRTREQFMNYFSENQSNIVPLEGIWQETSQLAHYVSANFYDYLNDKEVREFVIIKKDERYVCYDVEGGPMDAFFMPIAEGNRYLYKKYLRDIRETVSAFSMINEKSKIKLSYFYPDKYARYHHPEDIMPGDQLALRLELLKIFPEPEE
ncbi:MAG: hypothetical protein J7K53_09090 [Bacteroidales bacterium]|nr:hypothetical protein [Bacteroidales bacterium]